MSVITITIPGKPEPRQAHKIIKLGNGMRRTALTEKSEKYQQRVRTFARIAMIGKRPLQGCVRVDYLLVFPAPLSQLNKAQKAAIAAGELLRYEMTADDFDNVLKNLNDSIKHVAIHDDNRITDGNFQKRIGKTPRVVITITQIEE